LIQYISVKDRICSKCCLSCDLPEDVRSLCAAAQDNMHGGTHGKVLCYLEDPDIICAARERNICRYCHVRTPFIKSWSERHSANISGAQFSGSRTCSSGCISVCSFHITYRRSHISGSRGCVIGCIYFPGHSS